MAYAQRNDANLEPINAGNFPYYAPGRMDENFNENIRNSKGIRVQTSATQTVQKVDASTMTDPLRIDFRLTSEYLARCSDALGLPYAPKLGENEPIHYPEAANKVEYGMKPQHTNGTMMHHCPECPYKFEGRESLREHLDEHRQRQSQGSLKDRPHQCEQCGKAFKRNEHLARHMITHSGCKNHTCTQCGKAFYRKDHLKKHVQSHNNIRSRTTSQTPVPGHSAGEAFGSFAMMMQAETPPFFILRT